jgi:hypothetical protein
MIRLRVVPSSIECPQVMELFHHLLPNVSISILPIYGMCLHYYVDLLSISTEAVDFVIRLRNNACIVETFHSVSYEISLH